MDVLFTYKIINFDSVFGTAVEPIAIHERIAQAVFPLYSHTLLKIKIFY